ncbi:MAG: hypothetical protein DHS20C18_18940 [Saprospiraceae bacterium]|nr:MAG: hypothetical protein DHS20C18_18940 [Saprospiraceae bacterium]
MMRKVVISSLLLLLAIGFFSFDFPHEKAPEKETIKWMSFEEAVLLSKKNPKKMFIDIYTEWCGWCKKMDKMTFTNPEVVAYVNEHFYPVKLDAEQKGEIKYKGHKLKYVAEEGRRGVHELAYSLLEGKLGYPSFVYLDENQDRITISPGYKDAEVIIKELKFVGEEHYKRFTYKDYVKNYR